MPHTDIASFYVYISVFDNPKSVSFMYPSKHISMFYGLRLSY